MSRALLPFLLLCALLAGCGNAEPKKLSVRDEERLGAADARLLGICAFALAAPLTPQQNLQAERDVATLLRFYDDGADPLRDLKGEPIHVSDTMKTDADSMTPCLPVLARQLTDALK